MKKQLLLIALLLVSLDLSAQQIENSNFENWVFDDNSGGEKPGGNWMAATSCYDPEEVCFGFIFKDDEGKTGSGGHITGRGLLNYNAPFSEKPSKLSLWYKGQGGKIDVKILSLVTYEAIDENDIIGHGDFTLADAESFTNIEIPITYGKQGEVKSIQIQITGQNNSDFSFDEIELIYTVAAAITNQEITEIVGSNIVASSLILKENVDELSVYNTCGILVLSAANTQTMDFSTLPEGFYLISLKKGNAIGTLKVIKK